MAIYQPTNIVPSSFAGVGGGVVDASANVSVSWQVNGNSPMTGFEISVYENTAAATLVHTETVTLLTPFYGTDARGNPQTYTYEPLNTTWASWGLSNGNSYKYVINQTWTLGGVTQTTAQNSESVFVTRAAATLSISPSSSTLASVAQTFTGTYAQAQGDAVQWARWVLTDADGAVLDDTGTVYTQTLSYTYNRFFDGASYTVSLTVQTESGAEVSDSVSFDVSYSSSEAAGEMGAAWNPDDSVTLTWQGATSSPGTPSPSTGWGTAEGGVLSLASGATVTWDEVDGEAISVSAPYAAAWKGKVGEAQTLTGSGTIAIPADKAPDKTYPGTGTATEEVTAQSMTRVPKNDFSATESLSLPVTTEKSLISQISYNGQNMSELNALGFTYYTYRSNEGWYRTALVWTSYFEPVDIINLDYGAGLYLYSVQRQTDENGVTIFHNTAISSSGYIGPSLFTFTVQIVYRYYEYSGTYSPDHDGLNSIAIISMDKALNATGAPFAPQLATSVSDEDGAFRIYAVAAQSGTYNMTVSYKYAYEGTDAFEGSYSGVFDAELPPVLWERGELISAAVNWTTADGGTTITLGQNNAYTVKFKASAATPLPTAEIAFTYSSPTTGADSYWFTVTATLPANALTGILTVTTDATGGYTVTQTAARTFKIAFKDDGANTINYSYSYSAVGYAAGEAIALGGSPAASLSWAASSGAGAVLTVKVNSGGSVAGTFALPAGAWTVLFALKKPASGKCIITAYSWNQAGTALSTKTYSKTGILPNPVTSVTLTGEQTAYFVTLTEDPDANFNPVPDWTRETVLYARFYGTLEGGTLAAGSALGLMIFRVQGGELVPVGMLPAVVSSITDYGIRSCVEFSYIAYYVTNGTYSTGMATENFCRAFRQHTLIEAEPDADEPNTYHPVNVWRFNSNIDAGTYSSTNAPVLLDNFTAYPLWQQASREAKQGMLTTLLALTQNGAYQGDDAAQMDALFALAHSRNPLFYRDPKGNLYMVRLAGGITQTIDNSNVFRSVTVTVPWIEVGDASEAMIYTINEVAE